MPSVEQNSSKWDGDYDWPEHGDEWSKAWGGPASQWFGSILPRIHAFIPTDTILEIAPGYGRWTQFLKMNCRKLVAVDLSEQCIEVCRKRFAADEHIAYHINDGKSLDFIPDESIDFAFSFDSLVHAEADVIEAYLRQLARKLKPNGVGFIHHSNIGVYVDRSTGELPEGFDNSHWRAKTVSAEVFAASAQAARLQCISQEKINWGSDVLNDTFSVCVRMESMRSRPNRVLENPSFMQEADHIARRAPLYG